MLVYPWYVVGASITDLPVNKSERYMHQTGGMEVGASLVQSTVHCIR